MGNVSKTLEYIKLYNKLVKELQQEADVIRFDKFRVQKMPSKSASIEELMLFVFADAGFNSLEGSMPTQSVVVVIGSALTRGDFVEGSGCVFRRNASKITRVVRSSLACESVGVGSDVYLPTRFQMYLLELAPGKFFKDVLSATDNLPILNPFIFGREETKLSRINVNT